MAGYGVRFRCLAGNALVHPSARGARIALMVPKIVVLSMYERVPRLEVRFSRRNVFLRDKFTCQYCTRVFPECQLNLDHVTPRDKGGRTSWENIVTSCFRCNTRKANRLPHEASMRLIRKPVRPKWRPVISLVLGNQLHEQWKDFLDVAYWNVELED